MTRRIRFTAIAVALLGVAAAYWWSHKTLTFLPEDATAFVAQFSAPPAPGSPQERAELDELLSIQSARTPADRESARADRKKGAQQFYGALGLVNADRSLAPLEKFLDRAETDVSIYVRAAKHRFARLRPYVVESRLKPCIDDVADNQSYPSGHSTYGYVMALTLAEMVPERRAELLARADRFARSRMVCGVHFATDIAAGRQGAEWLVTEFDKNASFRGEEQEAARVLRAALALPPAPPR